MLRIPILIVNFKAYDSAVGRNAVKLAKTCEKVARKERANIAVAVQAADIRVVSRAVQIPVFAQHIDPENYGPHTGAVIAESVKDNGAAGTLLNHSEKRIRLDILESSINRAREVGLITIVCANDPDIGKAVSAFNCDFIAVEPPELIGGDISVSSAKPSIITDSMRKICGAGKCNKLIIGAGIKTREDVRIAIKLGAAGVLVASGVAEAEDPEREIAELAEGLKEL